MPISPIQTIPIRLSSLLKPFWRRLTGVARTSDWWESKLACMLGVIYAVAFYEGVATTALWLLLLQIIGSFVPCAAYVCVINDLTDQEEDQQAGKSNRMVERSAAFKATALGLCLLPGIAAGWSMRNYPVALMLYVCNWLAFTFYSAPPFRLKTKGVWGVLADTCGGQFLPTLWTAKLVSEGTGHAMGWHIGLPLGCWAFALGLRGILCHQLRDRENDQRAGVGTAVARGGAASVSRWVAWVFFPAEIAALICLLLRLDAPFTWPLLALHLLAETRRGSLPHLLSTWRAPEPEHWGPPAEYYKFYFPMTFALALSLREPQALGLVALHLLLFRHCRRLFIRDLCGLVRWRPQRLAGQSGEVKAARNP